MSFVYPAFLAALSLLAIPIILHLMSREVPRAVVFPTIRHILKGQRLQTGRRGLRDLITLLARLLILSAVVLIFARPELPSQPLAPVQSQTELVFFYDLSLSMSAGDFRTFVQTQSAEIAQQYPNARLTIITSSNAPGQVIRIDDMNPLSNVVSTLRPTRLRGNHAAALSQVPQLFSSSPTTKRHLYLFTDSQRSDWAPETLPALAIDAEIHVVQPDYADSNNLAILQVHPELFAKPASRRLRTTVQIRNYSLSPASARLTIHAGKRSASRDIRLGGEMSERFVVELDQPEGDSAVAELTVPESLVDDNRYYFWIGKKPPLQVAIVADTERDPRLAIERFFAQTALTVSLPSLEKIVATSVVPSFIWEDTLSNYDCLLFLDALSPYGDAEADLLQEYLEAGGTVILFSGNRTADALNTLNAGGLSKNRFQGYQGGVNQLDAFHIESVRDELHALSLFKAEPSDIYLFPIYKLARIEPAPNAIALLTVDNQSPFIIQETVGSGMLFTIATSLSPAWSELPTSLCFVPIVRRLVEYSGNQRQRGAIAATVGETSATTLIESGLPPTLELGDEPGVQLVNDTPVELNYTRAESDLRAENAYRIQRHLSGNTPADSNPAGVIAEPGGRPLRTPIVWCLAALLFVELLCANWRTRTQAA